MDRLLAGQALQAGDFLESPNGWMRLTLQNDGDVVLRRVQLNKGVSVSHSDRDPVTQLTMQIDGDLVASGATGTRHWHSGTDGNPGSYAVLQDDGLFVIRDSNGSLLQDYGTVIDWMHRPSATVTIATIFMSRPRNDGSCCVSNFHALMRLNGQDTIQYTG